MKIAVTGAKGRLGTVLVNEGCVPIYADILDPQELGRELAEINPDTIIHCAAITDVDKCEGELAKQARMVNVIGTTVLRNTFGNRIIYISTDYVFDGICGPYREDARPNPIGVYGMTKWMGEGVLKDFKNPEDIIVRTTILYGGHKPDFVTKTVDCLELEKPFKVPKTISGSPTYIPHLAKALLELCQLEQPLPRIINIAGSDVITRYEFALMIANNFGFSPQLIEPVRKFSGDGYRPKKAGLKVDLAKKLGLPIFSVIEGLKDMTCKYPLLFCSITNGN